MIKKTPTTAPIVAAIPSRLVRFYEDFLGLPLSYAFRIERTATGRPTRALHTFFRIDDGSHLAFFEVPDQPFEFKPQQDFDLHIALEVERADLEALLARALAAGLEARGIADHGIVESIYLRDPNGYVIELASRRAEGATAADARPPGARDSLDRWQLDKATSGPLRCP